MASREFQEFQARQASHPPPAPNVTLEQRRAGIDAVLGGMPLAHGTSARHDELGGVGVFDVTPGTRDDQPVVAYLHGGGFRLASALAYRAYGSHLAAVCDARVMVVDYRLAPEHRFPAALDDVLAVYRALLDDGVPPTSIVIAGDSAGGNLAAAAVLGLKAGGDPLPAGIVCCSPWVDLTNSAETYVSRREVDRLFSLESAQEATELYLGQGDPRRPLVSPVLGDWAGGPPALIQVGDAEVLLDDAARLAEVMRTAGVEVTHHVYDEMPHIWQVSYPAFPEAVEALEEIAGFVSDVTRRA